MQRSYLVKSSINFSNNGFFVKVGDILVHDPANGNKLTVYRNGAVVRDVKQTTLGLAAFVKNGMIAEVATPVQTPTAAPRTPAKPIPAPAKTKQEPKKEASAAPTPGVPLSKPEFDKLKESAKKPPLVDGLSKKAVKAAVKEVEIEDETI